jgi:cytoskeletal protein RodZ
MFSIGETLKRARLEQGLDLSTVSTRTKISANYLVAIESDDRKKLPSGFFYKSFVDQYARALLLDTKEIDTEIDRMLAEDAPLPLPGQDGNPIHRVPPMAVGRFRRRWPFASVASLILVVLGCSGVYAWWHDGRFPLELPQLLAWQKTPEVVEAAKPQEVVATPDAGSLSTHAEPEAVAPTEASAVPAQASAAPVATAPSAVERAPAVPQAPAAEQAPSAKSKFLLDLIAVEKTWLSVSSDGKPVFSGILAPRQTKTIAGKQFAKLTVGNAAGLKVRLNGKALGPLGARGQVLVVLFTPDNFQILSSAKEGD